MPAQFATTAPTTRDVLKDWCLSAAEEDESHAQRLAHSVWEALAAAEASCVVECETAVFAGATDVGEAMRGPMDALATSLRSLLEQHRSDAAAAHAEQRTTITERLEAAHEVEVRRLKEGLAYRERQHAARLEATRRAAQQQLREATKHAESQGRRAALQELRAASAQGGKANAPGVAEAQQKTRSRNLELIEEACALRVKLEGANEARRAEQQAAR